MVKAMQTLRLSFIASLQACAKKQDLHEVTRLHAEICLSGLLERDAYLGNLLVSMYAKCGALPKAQQVLYTIASRDVVSWSAVINGYAQRACGKEVVECYKQMQHDGIPPNAITYTGILRACGITQDIHLGKQIHNEIASQGLLRKDVVLGTALVHMYAKCGLLPQAQQVLDELAIRDVVSWSALIAGFVQKGQGKEALNCYERMQNDGFSPNGITYACILKACGIMEDIERGKQIHDEIVSQDLLEKDVVLGTALVDMYAKCGAWRNAQEVFDVLPVRNVASWSALIGGYAQHGKGEEALYCFKQMRSEGISPNAVTFACILKACGTVRAIEQGKQIHDEIVRQGLLQKNVMLGTALVDMYAKCGLLTKAKQVLNELPLQNVVAWNALITEYTQQGLGKQALDCYQQMQESGLSPDALTYVCVLKACSITGAFERGEQIHDEAVMQGLLRENVVLGNALVDMYAKWGALTKAKQVFDELPLRNIVSWNALIAGYAQQGDGEEALKCVRGMRYEGLASNIVSWNALIGGYALQGWAEKALAGLLHMQSEAISADSITFVCVLNACSHSGLVDEGQMCFEIMWKVYGIIPELEHYICMVDLFGRAGHFDKAMMVIQRMPSSDHLPVWSALSAACQKWGNVVLGRMAFDRAVQLDKNDVPTYVSMEKIYAAAGMYEDAKKVEARRLKLWHKRGLMR